MTASPVLFQIHAGAALLLLLAYTVRTYGARRAAGLIAPAVAFALGKEAFQKTPPYQVLIEGALPGWVVVASGWIVVYLLGLDVARRMQRRFRRVVAVVLVGITAATVSHAVEPLGQEMGWWMWHTHPGAIRYADGDWSGIVGFAAILGMIFGAPGWRRADWLAGERVTGWLAWAPLTAASLIVWTVLVYAIGGERWALVGDALPMIAGVLIVSLVSMRRARRV